MAVKIGFVGSGGIARAHLRSLENMPQARVVAVCDLDRSRAESVAEPLGASVHVDYHAMIENEDLDALYVCVPPFAHGEVEVLAAGRGLHLFVEKPVALSVEKARQVASAIKSAAVVSAVGYHWRYQTGTDHAREVLEGRRIAVLLGYWMSRMPGVEWWRVQEKSGGQVVEQTTHVFDLARYFAGEVADVYACAFQGVMAPKTPNYNVDDASTVSLRFRNGTIGNITSCDMLPLSYKAGLTIVAEDMVVELRPKDLTIIEKGKTVTLEQEGSAFDREDETFLKAVEQNDPSLVRSSYEDAVKTLEVTLAANESIDTGKVVSLG